MALFRLGLCALVLAFHMQAQEAVVRLDGTRVPLATVDATMERLMKAAKVEGAALAFLDQGKVSFLKAYGVRDKAKQLPLTPDSVMTAASFTKTAFAHLVLQLVDQGQLQLDQPIQSYLAKPLPEYPRYRDLAGDKRYRKITARMLLSHTAGFPNWRALTEDKKLHIAFEPGTRYAYSGEGIVLLQLVVEELMKRSLDGLMAERVFAPLGMTRTSMIWQSAFETDFAHGYDEEGKDLGPDRRPRPDAAGSMQTTVRDFSQFLAAVMQGERLKEGTWKEMLRPQVRIHSRRQFPTLSGETTHANDGIQLSYGLGWGLYTTPFGKAFFKEGHDDGWRNYAVAFPDLKRGMVIMTNSANGEGIFKAVLESLLGNPYTPIAWEGYEPFDEAKP
jgi:CubicO group peptidase (beta-lactamase class C family)